MAENGLEQTARALVAPGKGILAADESDGTIKKRFDAIQVESTEESRRAYREMLFTTPGMEEHISGVILYDETIRQSSADGTPVSSVPARSAPAAGSTPGPPGAVFDAPPRPRPPRRRRRAVVDLGAPPSLGSCSIFPGTRSTSPGWASRSTSGWTATDASPAAGSLGVFAPERPLPPRPRPPRLLRRRAGAPCPVD